MNKLLDMQQLWDYWKDGSEYFVSGNMIDKLGRTLVGKGLKQEVLNSFGVSVTENFFQEAIMDPLQELSATIFGGEDTADWENIVQRSLESGVDGIISAIILGGASVGIASAENVINKTNPTNNDYNKAIVDTLNSNKVDVKGIIDGANQAIIDNGNTQQFFATTFNNDGNVENVQPVKGKQINNPNKNIKVSPVIIRNNQDNYNIIDKNTGLLLDSEPYTTLIEAQAKFNNKMINLDKASIQNINNKIVQSTIAVDNKIKEIVEKQNVENTISVRKSENTKNTNSNTVSTTNTYNLENRQNEFRSDFNNGTTNYTISNTLESSNNGLHEVAKLMTQISDNSIYNGERTSQAFRVVTNNIPNIEIESNNNGTYLNSLNREGDVVYRQEILNKPYKGWQIKEVVNNAINNADLSNIQSTQTNENQFRANYVVQDINKVVKPFNKQESYSKDELAEIWNNEVSNNNYDAYYNSNGNIEKYIAIEEYGNNIVVNQYDSNDNVVKSDVIPIENGRYNNEDIIDTILKVSSNIDLSPYIQEMAYNFKDDLSNTLPGERYKAGDTWISQKRSTTKELADIKDETGASWNKIGEVLDDIANGRNNKTKLAKTIEQKLDEALSEGYTNIYGKTVMPNEEYLELKSKVYGRDFTTQISEDYDPTANMTDEDFRIFGMKKQNRKSNTEGNEVKSMKKESNKTTSNKTTKGQKNNTTRQNKYNNYTQKEFDNLQSPKIRIANNKNDVLSFIENAKKMPSNLKLYFGKITKNVANKIKNSLGIDVNNYNISLKVDAVRHILKNHSNNSQENMRGQVAITEQDILNIPEIINNYDLVRDSGPTDDGKPSITFEKNIDGNNIVVTYVSDKHNNLEIQTMYKFKNKKGESATGSNASNALNRTSKTNSGTNTPNTSISQNIQNVKDDGIRTMKNNTSKKSTMRTNTVVDNQGRTLSKQQQEYFKDSKVRDENGNLLVMYHGTEANVGIPEDFWFTIFDIDKAGNHGNMLGDGFYFTSDRSHAEKYSHTKGNIYETYLNIKNPLELNNFSTGELNYAIRNINPYIEADIYKRDGTIDGYKVRRYLLENGYDGIHSRNTYVAFNSNQIKNITNSSPTSNNDIRYMKKNNSKSKTITNNNSKNLIAQHNTSEEKLMEALDLGALPVPSIAITKSNTPISNYGDITLLFNKDTINPTDRRNVAYNSDIYSTRRPQTVNSFDKAKIKTFEKSMNNKGISFGYISQIEEYIQNNDFTRAKDTIRYELQKANPDITEQEIEDSFTEAIGIIKDKRILKEGVDPYTPSGNRKSIEQMSVPYTLDNIVRLMTKKSNKGSESTNFSGLPEVRANLSQQFKNIEEMHQQENNLVSTEEMQKVKEQLNDEFYNLIDEIGKYDKVKRYFGSYDTIANALNETAKAKNISKEVLENELNFVSITDVPDKTLQKAIDFLNSLKNVPTEYFEVKPQRAVGLKEIQSAIVPKNTSKELIDKLKENNIPITYYVTEQERNKLITNETKNKDIRFAKKSAKTPKVKGEVIEPGATNAQRESNYIEQEIRKIEESGDWDDSIPVTKMTDIRKRIEDYLGIGIQKGHFRQQAYGIYKNRRDVIRTKELKDIDTILHETGHALDIGKRIKINKEDIANELLKAVNNYGGYEAETREVQLEEGFAEVIREYTIVPEQARIDYPQTVAILEGIRQTDKDFNKFITDVQQLTYNYIHQNPENRGISNVSIGEKTDKTKWSKEYIQQEVMRNIYDKDWALKSAVNEMQKINGKKVGDLRASENAYYLTRLTSGIGDKVVSMLSKGYIDENGIKLMPGLNSIGEILGNSPERFKDFRALLIANRDLDYRAKMQISGIRSEDAKAIREKFKNDIPLQESVKIFYDTADGVLQYVVNNGLLTKEAADAIRKSNAFYAPMQRVLNGNRNNVGRRGAVKDVIKATTGSELDIKDPLENLIANSTNMIQQVENNNILKALYKQGEETGMTGKIYDVIDPVMVKVGTAKLNTWENELKKQGIDTSKIDLDKTIDLFLPSNKVDTNNLITSFIDDNGNRVYLQFHDDILFNSLMNMDKKFMSTVLNINRKLNMPLRYGATMANIGFAIPNVISDTAQAAIFSEAGFIPVVDNVIGIIDILGATNKAARNFFNKVIPGYADRINTMYALYEQSGATSATRMSQYRENTQVLMKNIYGTRNNEVLGIKEKYKPLKTLLDIMTYIPELSEQSTRFRVFEKNYLAYKNKGLPELDARIEAALQSRDATQDFGRTGNVTREINQLIPFSAARVGSAYTFAEKVRANPKRVINRMAVLLAVSVAIKAIGYDDEEIEELNQTKKDDNFVFKIDNQVITIKKPQGILRSIINLVEYVQDLFTGHIEEGKEGERLAEWLKKALTDNLPADNPGGYVPNMAAPIIENWANKDFYYNTDIVKSWDLDLPDSQQYYDYTSQLAIWLGQIFNYSPAKIDNLISGYFGGLGTQMTNIIDWVSSKLGFSPAEPSMGTEDNAVGKRFVVNVNENSASVDEIYSKKDELTKKQNGGIITSEEEKELENIKNGISKISAVNKQIKAIKQDLTMSGDEKANKIRPLQEQKVDIARQALGKDPIYATNTNDLDSLEFYPSRDLLSYNGYELELTEEMKQEYKDLAYNLYKRYEKQGLYNQDYLNKIKSKCKDIAKKQMIQNYRSKLVKND